MTPGRAGAALLVLTLITGAANLVATRDEVQTSNHRLRSVTATVAQLHAAEIDFCQDSNRSRAQQVALWVHIYDIGVNSHTPPKARAADNKLIAYIKKAFRARNCAAVYKVDSPG